TPRMPAAARRAVRREKDRYPLFPELLKHQTAEERLASIADERERWWQQMRYRHAKLWRKARQALRELPADRAPPSNIIGGSAVVLAIRSIYSPSVLSQSSRVIRGWLAAFCATCLIRLMSLHVQP